ncbi:uncharacterized protein LOC127258735 [Andrographis paniculata]|uniref:uncharacterized protein LOC127258735 n=1 Tax=Andrographis paniculata TaxID=175694 RepID=UPI0021E77B66|nr:uncharacterized protein LOC127258735 [Andrographis paniculata]
MRPEGNASGSSSSAPGSPSVKRGRDPEDEVYVDNLHSHKRYLSEIMASSLNGLTVGDHLSENFMNSPVDSESIPSLRDEISMPYSPMSEDSDEAKYYDSSSTYPCSSQPESAPTSPVSPYRCPKAISGSTSGLPTTAHPSHCGFFSSTSSHSPQTRHRGSDTEGRFPSSPSDICHSADLRRATLLKSVQLRTQPVGASQFELLLNPGSECANNVEGEAQSCPYMKLGVNEKSYQIDECTERGNDQKAPTTLERNLKVNDSDGE